MDKHYFFLLKMHPSHNVAAYVKLENSLNQSLSEGQQIKWTYIRCAVIAKKMTSRLFRRGHYRGIESWKEQIIKVLPLSESVYEPLYWPRLQRSQGVTVKPCLTPHCTFEVGSVILAPVFGWVAAKYCFPSQCLNFQRHSESESAVPPATGLMRGHVDWFCWKSLKW